MPSGVAEGYWLDLSSAAPSVQCFPLRRATRPLRSSRGVQIARCQSTAPGSSQRLLGYDTSFSKKYCLGDKLGSGAWATVYLVTCTTTGKRYACKKVEKWIMEDGSLASGFATRMQNEINIAKQLRHSLNVARLHEVLEDDRCLYLITELCTGGELGHRIKKGRYSERDAAHIIRDILQLLAQSHVQNVILRDVKPENLLFLNESEGSPLKAIDFGIARRCASNQYLSERCGSPVYVAPEVLQKRYSLPADVWSAGIIAYMLLTGRLPWKGEAGISVSQLYDGGEGGAFSRRDAFKALMFDELDFESHPWELISAGGRDLVQRMLQKDPAQRITAKAALKHRWLQSEGQGAAPDRPFEDTIVQRLQQFGMYGKVKQAALKQLVASLPSDSEVVQQFRDVFESGEQASQGSVSYNSLLQVLLGKGFCLTETEGHHLISLLDADGGGSVDEHEWMAATLDWQKVQESDEWSQWVERLLQAVASDASGCMEITDLKQVLLSAQCPRESDSEEDTSLQELAGTDQRVSVEDFKSMLVNDSSEDDLTMFDSRLDKRSTHNSNGS